MTPSSPRTAFVLGGGGVRGAVEVGMLRAILERNIVPDLLVGTSIGAMNAAAIAVEPSVSMTDKLAAAWESPEATAIYGDGLIHQFGRALRTHTHLNSPKPLREFVESMLGDSRDFADLAVELKVVAACIERASEHVFETGPIVPAIMASTAVPGLFPAAEVNGEHFVDGGVVNSIPISPAVDAGATEIYVLQVGRIEEPLESPHTPAETARVTFEISRRHRFSRDLKTVPDGVKLHVLPSGGKLGGDDRLASSRDMSKVRERIRRGYKSTVAYLDSL